MPVRTRSVQREPIGSISSLSLPVRPRAARHSVAREERHNAQLAAIIAASDHAIISLGTDFVVQTWNAGAQRMFGYGEAEARGRSLTELIIPDADELISKSVWEITHPDDLAVELAQFRQLEDGRVDSYSLDKRDLRKDGSIVWIRLTRSCVRKNDGSVDYFVAAVEDISARKRAEEELANSEARFRATFENAPLRRV